MTESPPDVLFISRALELARAGIGLASPNPYVGAVVVQDGVIVGEGTHTYEGRKHAEILALDEAGARARGSTLYLNLEPCSHTGRTPPCVDSVIAAGVKRVVASMVDPNPLVAGQGLERLRAAGIEVTCGPGEAEARKLDEAFAKWIRTRIPLVTLKSAMTLDGRIGMRSQESGAGSQERGVRSGESGAGSQKSQSATFLTGEEARAHVHELRHQSDAILVGVGTAIADDPLLTDRSGKPRRRPLLRVILDSGLRLPLQSRLVQTARGDLLVICAPCDAARRRELERRGVRVEQLPGGQPEAESQSRGAGTAGLRPGLGDVMRRLGELDITSVLVEGGSAVNGSVLAAGVADKVFFYYAPKILGSAAVPFAQGWGAGGIPEAPTVHDLTLHRFGNDLAVEGYLKDPYA
jgi:diaminohydroxyphosphoribosylaminopyrimidine deaminase/5-amino-6-(5-phosphoribosylamino)uracil reductase